MASYFPYVKNVSVKDEADVILRVKFVSNGNFGNTAINVPGPNDKSFKNEDAVVLGKAKDLRNKPIYCVSDFVNIINNTEFIKVNYYVNDMLIVEHSNTTKESRKPTISIILKIIEP